MNSDNLRVRPMWMLGIAPVDPARTGFGSAYGRPTRQPWLGSSRASRLPEIDSGRTRPNVYGAVPTVPTVPSNKETRRGQS